MKKTLITVLTLTGLFAPGLALAGDDAKDKKKKCSQTAQVCVHNMAEKFKDRGWIGIEMDRMDKENGRQVITKVVKASPAERAGLEAGDAIVAFNDIPLSEGEETVWAAMKKSLKPGKQITLTIERGSVTRDVDVTLSEVPKELLAQWIGKHMLEAHAEAPEAPEAPGE